MGKHSSKIKDGSRWLSKGKGCNEATNCILQQQQQLPKCEMPTIWVKIYDFEAKLLLARCSTQIWASTVGHLILIIDWVTFSNKVVWKLGMGFKKIIQSPKMPIFGVGCDATAKLLYEDSDRCQNLV